MLWEEGDPPCCAASCPPLTWLTAGWRALRPTTSPSPLAGARGGAGDAGSAAAVAQVHRPAGVTPSGGGMLNQTQPSASDANHHNGDHLANQVSLPTICSDNPSAVMAVVVQCCGGGLDHKERNY